MAIQNSGRTRSQPSRRANSAAHSGVVAKRSVTVDAVVYSSAYMNEYWLRAMPSVPPSRNIGTSRRRTRSVPSRHTTKAAYSRPPEAKRISEKAIGSQPSASLTTGMFSAHSATASRVSAIAPSRRVRGASATP